MCCSTEPDWDNLKLSLLLFPYLTWDKTIIYNAYPPTWLKLSESLSKYLKKKVSHWVKKGYSCDWGHVDVYIFTQHKTCRIKYSSRWHIMKLKGMWVSYKKTSQNFGCRGSSEAEPQLFCQCREGEEPTAQSSPFLLPLWLLWVPELFFSCFLFVSPHFATAQPVLPHEQVENPTKSSSAAPMLAMAIQLCLPDWHHSFQGTTCSKEVQK